MTADTAPRADTQPRTDTETGTTTERRAAIECRAATERRIAAEHQVETLVDALPWMKRFHGQIVVIKFGGNAMVDPALIDAFAEDIAFLRYAGVQPVIVHGGGPHITRMLDALGIESEFRGGFRVTSPEAMDVVRMVLGGQVARELVAAINEKATIATGTSGEDAGLFQARRKRVTVDGEEVDLGLVGAIERVNASVVRADIAAGRIPVVSSIASDLDTPRQALNINADLAASALAVELGAARLIILTDVPGLYERWPDESSLLSAISAAHLRELQPTLSAGMIPKVEALLEAVDGGVERASIIDGRVAHSVLLELFTSEGSGTMVMAHPDE